MARAAAVATIALLLVSGMPVSRALACTGDGPSLPAARFQELRDSLDNFTAFKTLIVLGHVVSEHRIDPQRRPILVPEASYVSDVEVDVVLAGDAALAGDKIKVGPNGYGAPDCSGGPRLLPGEKVILFVMPTNPAYTRTFEGASADSGVWQSGQFGVPILFDGPGAYYLRWGRFSGQGDGAGSDSRIPVGSSAEVLQLALDFAAASPGERQRAFELVLGIAPPDGTTPVKSITPPSAGDAGLRSGG